MNRINVLVSSVSKKIPLIKSLRKSLEKFDFPTKIIGSDLDSNCIGSYFVDAFIQFPPDDELTPELFISLCQYHEINAVIPTRDGELPFYAVNKERFAQEGIFVMVSDREVLLTTQDKLKFFATASEMGFPAIETSDEIDDIVSELFVVKERFGSGGREMGLKLSYGQAVKHAKHLKDPIFQPFISGQEYSIDFYVDKKAKAKGAIVRSRDLIIHGESQITTSLQDEKKENMCLKLAEELGLYGHGMFQMVENHILECNPRFGGASSLSLNLGLDSFYWFFLEILGRELKPFKRSLVEKKLIRYPEDLYL